MFEADIRMQIYVSLIDKMANADKDPRPKMNQGRESLLPHLRLWGSRSVAYDSSC